jgi:DNA-binding MarR family transcriptional regulator
MDDNNEKLLLASIIQTQAYSLLRHDVALSLKKFSLDPRLWSILCVVAQHPEGIRNNEIARMLHVKPALVTMRYKELIVKGLVSSQQHGQDKRSIYLHTTKKSEKFINKVNAHLANNLDKLISGVKAKDLDIYFKVLEKIIENNLKKEPVVNNTGSIV